MKITTSSYQALGLFGKLVGQIRCSGDYQYGEPSEDVVLRLESKISASTIWKSYIESVLVSKERMQALLRGTPTNTPLQSIETQLGQAWSAKSAPRLHKKAGIRFPKGRRSKHSRIPDAVMELMHGWNMQEKVFISDSGHLGSVLSGAQTGDQLCILYGGPLPYIVRPHEDGKHYTFICETYVPELMYGEALKMDLPETEFLLV